MPQCSAVHRIESQSISDCPILSDTSPSFTRAWGLSFPGENSALSSRQQRVYLLSQQQRRATLHPPPHFLLQFEGHPSFYLPPPFPVESLSDGHHFSKSKSFHILGCNYHMAQCTTRAGYAHFLMHSPRLPKDQFKTTQISFFHIALALGFQTPFIWAKGKGGMVSVPLFLRALTGLRWALWKDPVILKGMYSPGMFVAREEWPPVVRKAFRAEEPPTPYEMACAFLVEPTRNFWAAHRGAAPEFKCQYSALLWWLMGMPEDAMIKTLGLGEVGQLHKHIAASVHSLRGRPRFGVWALGIDLTPACTSSSMQEVASTFLLGKALPKSPAGSTRRHRNAQAKLLSHPYVKTQLTTGKRSGKLTRPLYSPGIIWPNIDGKRAWERGETSGAIRVRESRKQIRPDTL